MLGVVPDFSFLCAVSAFPRVSAVNKSMKNPHRRGAEDAEGAQKISNRDYNRVCQKPDRQGGQAAEAALKVAGLSAPKPLLTRGLLTRHWNSLSPLC